jgi:hypothetical protein
MRERKFSFDAISNLSLQNPGRVGLSSFDPNPSANLVSVEEKVIVML